jgi:hypothetical protein
VTDAVIAVVERYLFWLVICLFVAQAAIPSAPAVERFVYALIIAAPLLVAADSFTHCIRLRRRKHCELTDRRRYTH